MARSAHGQLATGTTHQVEAVMTYADLIRQARDKHGWAQRHVADLAGLTVQHYGQIERGIERGSDDKLAAIAHVLGIPADQLESDGRDGAADRLRELQADEPRELTGDERLDDALMLQAILGKLTPGELRWLVAHADILERLHTQPNAENPHPNQAVRRAV